MRVATLVVLAVCGSGVRAEDASLKEVKSREFKERVQLLVAAKDDVLVLTPVKDKKNTLALISVDDGKVRREFDHPGAAVDTDAAGKILAFGAPDGTIFIYDLTGKAEARTLKGKEKIARLAVSADGQYIATGHADDKTLEVWELATGKSQAVPIDEAQIGQLAVGNHGLVATCRFDAPRVEVYDGKNAKELNDLAPTDQPIGQMEFSQDGKKLLTTGIAGVVKLWNVAEGKADMDMATLGAKHSIFSANLSPDATLMITSELNGKVGVWDVSTGKLKVEKKAYPDMQPGRIVRFLGPTKFATCCDPGFKTIIWEYSPAK